MRIVHTQPLFPPGSAQRKQSEADQDLGQRKVPDPAEFTRFCRGFTIALPVSALLWLVMILAASQVL